MRVLVTGHDGFIGRHLVETLLKADHEVSGIDMMPPSDNCSNMFFQCNLLDRNRLFEVIDAIKPDSVVHLAARTDLDGADIDAYAVNTTGTCNLIEAMAKTGGVRRYIFTSTQLVHALGRMPASDKEYCPDTPYGASKAAMEHMIRERMEGKEWCITRPTKIWGPGIQEHHMAFFRMVKKGRYFHVGRNPLWKSYGYVRNVAYQYLKLLEAPSSAINGQVFYLADYRKISLQHWADEFQKAFDARRIPTVPVPFIRIVARIGDAMTGMGFRNIPLNSFRLENMLCDYVYDLSATEKVCGELPYTLEQGVRETVRWMESSCADDRSRV